MHIWSPTNFCGFGLEHAVPIHNFLNLAFECKCHNSSHLMRINVFKWSSNPEGLPECGVSLMLKRSFLKQENHFLPCSLFDGIVPVHGTNVSGHLCCFHSSIELKEENMSEMFQFLHFALHFLASLVPLTIFKWQNFNM